jgi:hypothetical protein
MNMLRPLPAACLIAIASPALAGEPACPVTETCRISDDYCQPAEGMPIIKFPPQSGKVAIHLNDNPPLESAILDKPGQTTMSFMRAGEEHQLRVAPDGKFNYLITIHDPQAPGGCDQTLYRRQCLEG